MQTVPEEVNLVQFISLNQLRLNPHVLTPTPLSREQPSIPLWDKRPPILTVITPFGKRMSPSQQRDLSLQVLTSIPPADFQIFTDGSVQDGIEDGGAGLTDDPRAPIVAPSRQRRPPSKKPPNGYPPFHHRPLLSSSAFANHWSRPPST